MSKFKKIMLPRLLLLGAFYQFLEIPLKLVMYSKAPGGFRLAGMSEAASQASHYLSFATSLLLGILCLVLAFAARAYYGGDPKLPEWKGRFTLAANAYCICYALNSLPGSWLTLNQFQGNSVFAVPIALITILKFFPVIAFILIIKDLLNECLVLRDEAAHTV